MFNANPKLLARLARNLERVVIVDSNAASIYLLSDMLRRLGAKRCLQASTTERGLELCGEIQPQILFSELSGPELDGPLLTSRLRRSGLAARTAPVVIVSWDTRAQSIRRARDSGAHEYLGKPFSTSGVFRRVENVLFRPRPWVENDAYAGPDRRRFNAGAMAPGRGRRETDQVQEAASTEEAFLAAEEEIRAELVRTDEDSSEALRRMMEQTFRLQRAARLAEEEEGLDDAIEGLQRFLIAALATGRLDTASVIEQLNRIGGLRHVAVSRATRTAAKGSSSVTLF